MIMAAMALDSANPPVHEASISVPLGIKKF